MSKPNRNKEILVTHNMPIEPLLHPAIIGPKGATIKRIKTESGVKSANIDRTQNALELTGRQECVDRALKMVQDILASRPKRKQSEKSAAPTLQTTDGKSCDDETQGLPCVAEVPPAATATTQSKKKQWIRKTGDAATPSGGEPSSCGESGDPSSPKPTTGPSQRMASMWSSVRTQSSPTLDFTIRFADGSTYRAHREILQEKSEYFRAMFSAGMCDSQLSEFSLDCESHHAFTEFLEFLYLGRIKKKIEFKSFFELFKLAQFLGCPDLCVWLLGHATKTHILPAAETLCLFESACAFVPQSFCELVSRNLATFDARELKGVTPSAIGLLLQIATSVPMFREGNVTSVECFQFLSKWQSQNFELQSDEDSQMLIEPLLDFVPFEKMWLSEFAERVEHSGVVQSKSMLEKAKKRVPFSRAFSTLRFDFSKPPLIEHPTESFCGLAVCQQTGRLCVTHDSMRGMQLYDAETGKLLRDSTDYYTTEFKPRQVAFGDDDTILVGGDNRMVVNVHSAVDGSFLRHLIEDDEGGHGNGTSALAFDSLNKEVYVVNRWERSFNVVGIDGSQKRRMKLGNMVPCSLALDNTRGLIFAAFWRSCEISVFDTQGGLIGKFGHELGPDIRGRFSPSGLKLLVLDTCGGHVLVADEGLSNVQVFKYDGTWVAGLATPLPVRGMAVGSKGEVFLCFKGPEGPSQVYVF